MSRTRSEEAGGSVGFWHAELHARRNRVFTKWAGMTLLIGISILGLLSLYWGALYHVRQNLPAITVAVVDFDSAGSGGQSLIGPIVVAATKKRNSLTTPHVGYIIQSAEGYGSDAMRIRRAVYGYEVWAAVVICKGATEKLVSALRTGNESYDPMGAVEVIYVQARQEVVANDYLLPDLHALMEEVLREFGSIWVRKVAEDGGLRANLERVPQAVNPGIGFTMVDLRPFDVPAAKSAVTVGLIYLIIFSFFSFPFYLPIHQSFLIPAEGHRSLHFSQWLLWRLFAAVAAYFFLSLCYSLVPLAFGVPFEGYPFVVYWMLNWAGMTALGLPSENMSMLLGAPWFAIWLIFWVITNVATSFYPVALAPWVYKYGYAWPLHSLVEVSRGIIFNVKSEVGWNFGVLLAWAAVSIALLPACSLVEKTRAEKEAGEAEKPQGESQTGGSPLGYLQSPVWDVGPQKSIEDVV